MKKSIKEKVTAEILDEKRKLKKIKEYQGYADVVKCGGLYWVPMTHRASKSPFVKCLRSKTGTFWNGAKV